MFIDLRPIRNNAQFRKLFLGQTISFFGSMVTYAAVPYQVYQLSKNSFLVGALGIAQLLPLLVAGLYGGALADVMDRKKLLIISEVLLTVCSLLLLANSLLPQPTIWMLFLASALSSVFVGLHRPAMESITPQIVTKEEYPAVAALGSLRYSVGAIAGPALGGWLIATKGEGATYLFDAITYFISLYFLWSMKNVPTPKADKPPGLASIVEGVKYAAKQPVILGTYLVDIVAMIFAMPMALFPAMAEGLGGASAAGWLYSAIPMGALAAALVSGLAKNTQRHGAGVIISAVIWGVFIVVLAYANNLYLSIFCLAMAGVADAFSGIYRQTIWNESIPTNFRGRLAGLNMLSYMTGPLLGNARAGFVASVSSNFISILSGGILCLIGCLSFIWLLPQFWSYKSSTE